MLQVVPDGRVLHVDPDRTILGQGRGVGVGRGNGLVLTGRLRDRYCQEYLLVVQCRTFFPPHSKEVFSRLLLLPVHQCEILLRVPDEAQRPPVLRVSRLRALQIVTDDLVSLGQVPDSETYLLVEKGN